MPTNWKRSIRRVAAESLALFFRGARWLHRDAFYWQRCEDPSYWLWLRRHRRPVASALPTGAGPRFSILLPAHDTRPAWLRETVDSVRAQSRGDWELIVVDDASPDPASRATLDALPDRDPRIRLLRHPVNRGIAASTNHAAESARGEWLLLLDHDDLLCPDTLAALAAGAEAHPEAGLLYTDEDRLSPRGLRYRPHFKPGFSPSRLEMCNYILHPLCVRRTVWQAHGGMRPRFDGSQDYDLLLRLWDAGVGFAHVPGVYYTWRESPDSMAGGADKPHIFAAGRAALGEHLRRRGETAEVGDNPETELGDYRIIFPRPATLRLGVIGGPPDLPLPAGWSLERLETLDGPDSAAGVDAVLWLAPELECDDWPAALGELLAWCRRADVGVVGARVVAPDGRILHAGQSLTGHGLRDDFRGRPLADAPDARRLRDCLALAPAALAVAGAKLARLQADPLAAPAALELCLRARQQGWRVVVTPFATFRMARPVATPDPARARERLRAHGCSVDPFRNPHLTSSRWNDDRLPLQWPLPDQLVAGVWRRD